MTTTDDSPAKLEGVLIAGVGTLQILLTALGITGGTLTAIEVNEHLLFVLGLVAVLIAVGSGLLVLVVDKKHGLMRSVSKAIGSAALLSGLVITVFAATAAPTRRSDPVVNVKVSPGKVPQLEVKVSATGVKRSEPLQIAIVRLRSDKTGALIPVPPALYHAQLGASPSGEVASTLSIPVPPPSRQYSSIDIDAWTGDDRHLCGFSTTSQIIPGRGTVVTASDAVSPSDREGCALVRMTDTKH